MQDEEVGRGKGVNGGDDLQGDEAEFELLTFHSWDDLQGDTKRRSLKPRWSATYATPLRKMARTNGCPMNDITRDQRSNLFLLGTKLSNLKIVRHLVGSLLYKGAQKKKTHL